MTGDNPDARGHAMAAEELSGADRALLAKNWWAANDALDEMLGLTRVHRAEGCVDWYCGPEELIDQLNGYRLHEVMMILSAAMERLVAVPESDA